MSNDDYYDNSRLRKYLESEPVMRHSDSIGECEDCGEELEAGDDVYVVSWTPPVNAVADSSTVDRQFNRRMLYCASHEDGARMDFDDRVQGSNFANNDVVMFAADVSQVKDGLGFDTIRFHDRSLPVDWD